ncbi:MAG: type I-E CRISPR-associated protein Cas6/Cse3/CasE [Alphaproteobacteria bacterium]|nr:MAG: type I-E CRISPR-associated protein Cas6/Cse3/CasE [Alphaproteobacteria bacterium]
MYLSRLTLARKPDVAALGQLLDPAHEGRRMDAHHRLIWSAFAGDPEASRDFLWRDMGRGQFMVLSPRPPAASALFEPPEVKPFTPDLSPGDRLAFVLRANATRTIKTDRITTSGKRERQHNDVVMEALRSIPRRRELPPDEGSRRARQRLELAQKAGANWLAGQGARGGFLLLDCHVSAYDVRDLPGQGKRRPRFGVLDFEGVLEVTEPPAFLARLCHGFGRAKAFGCGLMLIRRA